MVDIGVFETATAFDIREMANNVFLKFIYV